MKEDRICKYCKVEFRNVEGRVHSNHVRWCDQNPTKNNTANISKGKKKGIELRQGVIKEFTVHCNKCGKDTIVSEREKLHPINSEYYCSRSCANSRTLSKQTKEKISNSLLSEKSQIMRPCPECNIKFKHLLNKFCSNKCAINNRRVDNGSLKSYRNQCKFKFSLNEFNDEFDFSLIDNYGWYKAKNNGDNPDGVSRDHCLSVRYGFDNNIDPLIISHPANCQLVTQRENASKGSKCSITLEELLEKIEAWNNKYIF